MKMRLKNYYADLRDTLNLTLRRILYSIFDLQK